MRVAILGTGIVGRTIAARLLAKGHVVAVGTRNVENTLEVKGKGGPAFKEWYDEHAEIQLQTFEVVTEAADLIFNCTNGQASVAVLEAIGKDRLDGKILIDLANPLDFSAGMPPSLDPVNTYSLGEQIQDSFPKLKVVKSLNTMNAQLMLNPSQINGDHNVFVCGNDDEAKNKVKELLMSFGWRKDLIIDLGDISNSRGTEMILPVWLRLWAALGTVEFNFLIQTN